MNQLDRLEMLAQRLIEGPFKRIFQTQLHPADLAHQLAVAIEQGQQNGTSINSIPNHYYIWLNPTDYKALVARSNHDAIVANLHDYIARLVQEAQYQLPGTLRVWLEQRETILPGQVKIKTNYVTS